MYFYQGADIGTILTTIYSKPTIETKNEMVDKLLARGGLLFMMETISLVICALSFGGAIKAIGAVDTIIQYYGYPPSTAPHTWHSNPPGPRGKLPYPDSDRVALLPTPCLR